MVGTIGYTTNFLLPSLIPAAPPYIIYTSEVNILALSPTCLPLKLRCSLQVTARQYPSLPVTGPKPIGWSRPLKPSFSSPLFPPFSAAYKSGGVNSLPAYAWSTSNACHRNKEMNLLLTSRKAISPSLQPRLAHQLPKDPQVVISPAFILHSSRGSKPQNWSLFPLICISHVPSALGVLPTPNL